MLRKRKIKASRIIADIRSGMTVSQLMDKYGISSRGLRIVLRKLLSGRAITKTEMGGDTALYRDTLGVKGIRRWIRQATILPVRVYDSGNPSAAGTIRDISEKGVCVQGIEAAIGEIKKLIVRSGAFGAGRTAVFEAKCRWVNHVAQVGKTWVAGFEITSISSLDSAELRKLVPQCLLEPEENSVASLKRTIKAKAITRDIRTGISSYTLRQKYGLSHAGLEKIFLRLIDAGLLTSEDLDARFAPASDPSGPDYLRASTGEEPVCLVPIYEEAIPETRGAVCELTQENVCVAGIVAAVHDIKRFVIPADEFFNISPFSFEAECRWVENQANHDESVAGFAITHISDESQQRLNDLIRSIKLPG